MDLLSSRMTCRIKWGGENDLKESDKSQIVVLHRVLGQNISKWGGFQSMKGVGNSWKQAAEAPQTSCGSSIPFRCQFRNDLGISH